jgi:2-haloacid dehalogenase
MNETPRPRRDRAPTRLRGIRACVFDAYGTLFDFASATARCTDIPADVRAALTASWRDKQLQYTWLRTLQGDYADFWRVTSDALDFALDSLGIASAALHTRLMNLYMTLAAFPEVPQVLQRLREAGFVTAILSNGTPAMLTAAVRAAGIDDSLDAVLSADAVQKYKTHPRVYEYCLQRLGLEAREVSFQSSNAWDAYAASAFGMRVVWCNRYGQRRERLPGQPDHEIRSLADLPALLESPR